MSQKKMVPSKKIPSSIELNSSEYMHINIWEYRTNGAVEMGYVMDNDGPVAAVQIRLAKGEITPGEYEEIISRLMKNVSSCQQTSSLKALQIRYAKSEITAEQYQERLANLMKKLNAQPWSPPLHILHVRYAEGEITSDEYTQMFDILTQEQFSYEQSTALWIVNNRYARGELTTGQYEEILSLFSGSTPSHPQELIKPKVAGSSTGSVVEGIHPSSPVQSPVQNPIIGVSSGVPGEKPEPALSIEPPAANDNLIRSAAITENGKEDSEEKSSSEGIIQNSEEKPDSVISPEKSLPKTVDKTPDVVPSIPIPDLKPSGIHHVTASHFPASSGSSVAVAEALPSDFLYPAGKHEVHDDIGMMDVVTHSDLLIDYSMTPISTGGRGNTYETVTSPPPALKAEEKGKTPGQGEEPLILDKIGDLETQDRRQQIKMLIVKGNYEEAVALADVMMHEEPESYRPYFFKGMARYYLHIYDKALEDLNRAKEMCKNKEDLKKIDTIRSHILNKKQETEETEALQSDDDVTSIDSGSIEQEEPSPELLDTLGKEAQDLIDKKDFKAAEKVLSEFISHSTGLSQERLKTESVDEIYAAMGYVKYQLKNYQQARDNFHEALKINAKNEVANQFMQDILIRAAKKK